MKSEKILYTMNEISDELIEDATIHKINTLSKRKNTEKQHLLPKSHRAFRLGFAAALIACLLGTAVFAAGTWIFNPHVKDSWDVLTPTGDNGNGHSGTTYVLSFCLPLKEDAPELIETYYFPQVPSAYKQSFGYAYAGMNYDRLGSIIYSWDIPDGEVQGMMFYQESGLDSNMIEFYAGGTPEFAPEMKEVRLGGVDGVLIVETICDFPHQYFFWSDGEYVFHMRFPVEFTEEQMAQVIGSIIEVEDAKQYLISMTEEELKKTFG